jgi:hypothetical protein
VLALSGARQFDPAVPDVLGYNETAPVLAALRLSPVYFTAISLRLSFGVLEVHRPEYVLVDQLFDTVTEHATSGGLRLFALRGSCGFSAPECFTVRADRVLRAAAATVVELYLDLHCGRGSTAAWVASVAAMPRLRRLTVCFDGGQERRAWVDVARKHRIQAFGLDVGDDTSDSEHESDEESGEYDRFFQL